MKVPVELVVEILKNADWSDVLGIRRTNRAMHDISTARPLWLHLLTFYTSPSPLKPKKYHLERPLGVQTANELERLFCLWKSAEIGWRTSNKPVRERFIRGVKCSYAHLVPGGRWMLFVKAAGAVVYYDLDARELAEEILISPQGTRKYELCSPPDVLADSKIFTFNLAIGFGRLDPLAGPVQTIQVWQASLVFGDDQKAAKLHAVCLSSFTLEPAYWLIQSCRRLSLGGPVVAFWTVINGGSIVVIPWKQANHCSSNYPRRTILRKTAIGMGVMDLIPSQRILIRQSDRFESYDILFYGDIVEKTCISSPSQASGSLRPVTSLSIHANSRPVLCGTSLRHVTFHKVKKTRSNVIATGVMIDDSTSLPMISRSISLGTVMKWSQRTGESQMTYVGDGHSFFLCGDRLVLLSYSWPPDDPKKQSSVVERAITRRGGIQVQGQMTDVDEGSGRIVCERYDGPYDDTIFWIIDVALIHP